MRNFAIATTLAVIWITMSPGNIFAGMITVDFDTVGKWTAGSGSITGYQTDHTYSDQGFTFTGGPALRSTATAQDGFPSALGTHSWRLRDVSGVSWTATYSSVTPTVSQIGSLSFAARRWDESPVANYSVGYSVDGGTIFTSLTTLDNAAFDNSSAWKTFTFNFVTPVLSDNKFVVRFVSPGSTSQIMVDNFSVTAVPEPTSLVMVGLAGVGGFAARRISNKKRLKRKAKAFA